MRNGCRVRLHLASNVIIYQLEGVFGVFYHKLDEFLSSSMSVDETCTHHNRLETKKESTARVSLGESGPKLTKVGLSANKVVPTVF